MSNWKPTPELRYAVPPYTTTLAPVLQQKWFRETPPAPGLYGHGEEYEWRPVPRVVDASPALTAGQGVEK